MKMFIGGCCCAAPEGWVTIRGYNLTNGAIIWEHKLWSVTVATDSSLVGVGVVESAETYSHVYHRRADVSPPARGADTHGTAGKKTWELRVTRVTVATGVISEQSAVLGYIVAASDFDVGLAANPVTQITGGGTLRVPTTLFDTQNYGATATAYISNNPNVPTITYFDPHSSSATLKYRIEPHGVSPTFGSATWSWGIPAFGGDGATTAEWAHNATAATIETALEAAPQIISATVTGGPLPHNAVDITVEWADASLQFTNTNRTNFDMELGTIISSSTGNAVGYGNHVAGSNFFATNGYLIRELLFTGSSEFSAVQADTLGEANVNQYWTETVTGSGSYVRAKSKIIFATELVPVGTDPDDAAGQIGKLIMLDPADGTTLSDTSMQPRFPDFAVLADDSATAAYVRGTKWAPSTPTDTTPSETEAGLYGFQHDAFIDDLTDGLNPQYTYPSGVNGIGANSTRLAFFNGGAGNSTPTITVPQTGSGFRTATAVIGGDALYPDSYTRYTYKPAHKNRRSTTAAEWRIGLGPSSWDLDDLWWTDWMAYTADFDAVNAELRATYGEHTAITLETYNNNVRVLFDPGTDVSGIAAIPNMLWQGDSVRIMVIGGVSGSPNNLLSGTYSDTNAALRIQMRNEVFPRTQSFGAMNWTDGTVAWQSNFGERAVSIGDDTLYGDQALLENGVLVVRDIPSNRLT